MARQSFQSPPVAVLVTRPAPQAERFAADLRRIFGTRVLPVLSPLMAPRLLDVTLPPGPFAALVLTSETGAKAAGRLRAALPDRAFCVGDRTAEAAARAGFATVSADGAAGDLAALIAASPDEGALLYLHGADRAADPAVLIPGRRIVSLATYVQEPSDLTPEARALLASEERVILPVFSPRSARLFVAAAGPCRADLCPVAISANARDALPEPLAARTVVARAPNAQAMIDAMTQVLGDGPP